VQGTQFLWDIATWNQGLDDLREVDALAVLGTGDYYGNSNGASDGVLPSTSASLLFTPSTDERPRIVPYCHTLSGFLSCYNSTPIAKVDSESHLTSRIIRSFLADTGDRKTVGTTPSRDPYLAKLGGVHLAFEDALHNFVADIDEVRYKTADGTFT
jgi:hypothetical protein